MTNRDLTARSDHTHGSHLLIDVLPPPLLQFVRVMVGEESCLKGSFGFKHISYKIKLFRVERRLMYDLVSTSPNEPLCR